MNQKPICGIYTPGLMQNEPVISAHFMHDINQNASLKLYTPTEFKQHAVQTSARFILNQVIPSVLKASHEFVKERVLAAKIRAKKHYREYGLTNVLQLQAPEFITEVMFDRQYLKGPKRNNSRRLLAKEVSNLIDNKSIIGMIIPALPYKSSSPLKSRGIMPDFADISFLLSLAEIAKTIDIIYQEHHSLPHKATAKFTVISDGSRFNTFVNEPLASIQAYQDQLRWWIKTLGIGDFVEVVDYQWVIRNYLPEKIVLEKKELHQGLNQLYAQLMSSLLNPYDMQASISKAVQLDPAPETCHVEGRFIPLFKSLIYIVRYKVLLHYCQKYGQNYVSLYTQLTRNIFKPYALLSTEEFDHVETFIQQPHAKIAEPQSLHILEYLRQTMLSEAWKAAIDYISEIRSDRDLSKDPITTCFPYHIRWTIHAKLGQLAILTTTASGDPVQPWHGACILKFTKNNKIKMYTLPVLSIEGNRAVPITILNDLPEKMILQQPLFYVDADIPFSSIEDLASIMHEHLTRKRKGS